MCLEKIGSECLANTAGHTCSLVGFGGTARKGHVGSVPGGCFGAASLW